MPPPQLFSFDRRRFFPSAPLGVLFLPFSAYAPLSSTRPFADAFSPSPPIPRPYFALRSQHVARSLADAGYAIRSMRGEAHATDAELGYLRVVAAPVVETDADDDRERPPAPAAEAPSDEPSDDPSNDPETSDDPSGGFGVEVAIVDWDTGEIEALEALPPPPSLDALEALLPVGEDAFEEETLTDASSDASASSNEGGTLVDASLASGAVKNNAVPRPKAPPTPEARRSALLRALTAVAEVVDVAETEAPAETEASIAETTTTTTQNPGAAFARAAREAFPRDGLLYRVVDDVLNDAEEDGEEDDGETREDTSDEKDASEKEGLFGSLYDALRPSGGSFASAASRGETLDVVFGSKVDSNGSNHSSDEIIRPASPLPSGVSSGGGAYRFWYPSASARREAREAALIARARDDFDAALVADEAHSGPGCLAGGAICELERGRVSSESAAPSVDGAREGNVDAAKNASAAAKKRSSEKKISDPRLSAEFAAAPAFSSIVRAFGEYVKLDARFASASRVDVSVRAVRVRVEPNKPPGPGPGGGGKDVGRKGGAAGFADGFELFPGELASSEPSEGGFEYLGVACVGGANVARGWMARVRLGGARTIACAAKDQGPGGSRSHDDAAESDARVLLEHPFAARVGSAVFFDARRVSMDADGVCAENEREAAWVDLLIVAVKAPPTEEPGETGPR